MTASGIEKLLKAVLMDKKPMENLISDARRPVTILNISLIFLLLTSRISYAPFGKFWMKLIIFGFFL